MEHATFSIDPGAGRVEVNGQRVEGVAAVRFDQTASGGLPVVTIQQHAHVEPLAGTGVVQIIQEGPQVAVGEVIQEWLSKLDPDTLEQQALDRQGWGSGTLAGEILAVLADLAKAEL